MVTLPLPQAALFSAWQASENFFPNTQSKLPLVQFETISSSITCYLGEETHPRLVTVSFQTVPESDKVLQLNYNTRDVHY